MKANHQSLFTSAPCAPRKRAFPDEHKLSTLNDQLSTFADSSFLILNSYFNLRGVSNCTNQDKHGHRSNVSGFLCNS